MKKIINTDDSFALIEKMQNSNVVYKEVLFNFFIPISKISANSVIYKEFTKNGNKKTTVTEFGIVQARNRLLTEKHREIITTIIQLGKITGLPDGKIGVFFKEIDILKKLKMGERNHARLREDILTIIDAKYVITIDGFTRTMSILEDFISDDKSNKKIQGVVFDKKYVLMHKYDFSANYNETLNKIYSIKYSTIPSIINYLYISNKSDQKVEYNLKEVLMDLGFPVNSIIAMKNIKKNLKEFKEELAEEFQIYYDDSKKTLTYGHSDMVTILEPLAGKELEDYIGKEFNYKDSKYIIEDILQIDDYIWHIVTADGNLEFNNFKDDFIFFLEQTTNEVKGKNKLIN